jgi:fumarate reductase flavoprotein subunit
MGLFDVPKKWDGEADIVIVGAGNAGLPAAITAREKGASVIVLETWKGAPASSLAIIGGGTLFVGTDLQKQQGINDSVEACLKEVDGLIGGRREIWKAMLDRNIEVYEWLKTLGAKPQMLWRSPGISVLRTVRFEGHGARLLKILLTAAQEKGVNILYEHRAQRLVLDPVKGRVIGVTAKFKDQVLSFKAKKAVIIATGGFAQNKEMVQEYGPHYTNTVPSGPPTHWGDGLKMGMAIGAGTYGLGLAVCPSTTVDTETKNITVMWNQGGILVNMEGKRWTAEMGGRPYGWFFSDLLFAHPDGEHRVVYDERIRKDASAEDYKKVKEYKADTLEDLAKLVGLPVAAFVAEVKAYNDDLDKNGYDTKFGRKMWGGLHGTEPPPKISTPPFYAIKGKVSLSSLKGGLSIDTKAHVLDLFGNIVPGLYAAGEVTGGLQSKPNHYYPSSLTLYAFVYGRIAGEEAAAEVAN